MSHLWVRRRWVEQGLVGLAGFDGALHGVVDLQDNAFGAVLAGLLDLLLLQHGKGHAASFIIVITFGAWGSSRNSFTLECLLNLMHLLRQTVNKGLD